jgi:hypothetical protein
LQALAGSGATEQQLADLDPETRPEQLAELYFLIRKFASASLLAYSVPTGTGPLATALPIGPDFRLAQVEAGPGRRWVL